MGPLPAALAATLLLAALPPDDGTYWFPAEQRGAVTATLGVRVAERGAVPGLGRATLTVVVEGPAELEVRPLRLEDATEAWKAPRRASSWSAEDGRVRWAESVELVQAKPGPAPLPGVRLRCREGPAADWHELRWVDLLKEPRGAPPPEELPPLPPSPWPGRLRWGGAAVGALLALLALAWGGRRWLARPPGPLPAHVRALRELDALGQALPPTGAPAGDFCGELAGVLRGYLAERFDLDAARKTSDELVAALAGVAALAAEQREAVRDVLARCDLAKFAGASPDAEECRRVLGLARAVIEPTPPPGRSAFQSDGRPAQGPSGSKA
jgi:hypothetical protein